MSKEYHYSEADIDWMIEYIKSIDPENATPEMAIKMLENEYAKNHKLSHENPEVLEAIYADIQKKKETQ